MSTPTDLPVPDGNVPLPAVPSVGLPAVIPQRGGVVGFLSSVTRRANWLVPRQLRVAAALGNVELDLMQALIGPGVSEIHVIAVMGNVEITVPTGIRVECDVGSHLGVFEVIQGAGTPPPADAPLLRITGSSLLGCVEVRIAGTAGLPVEHEDEDD